MKGMVCAQLRLVDWLFAVVQLAGNSLVVDAPSGLDLFTGPACMGTFGFKVKLTRFEFSGAIGEDVSANADADVTLLLGASVRW